MTTTGSVRPRTLERVATTVSATSRAAFIAWFLVAIVATFWIWQDAVFTRAIGEGDWPNNYFFVDFLIY